MPTSQTTFLSKPTGEAPIPRAALRYILRRNRQLAYNLVVRALKDSGISQATLARRLDKAPAVVSRLLSRPRNWEQDTFGELVFALTGGGLSYGIELPRTGTGPLQIAPLEPEKLPASTGHGSPLEAFSPEANKPLKLALSLTTS